MGITTLRKFRAVSSGPGTPGMEIATTAPLVAPTFEYGPFAPRASAIGVAQSSLAGTMPRAIDPVAVLAASTTS
jgi:hypothetical protein